MPAIAANDSAPLALTLDVAEQLALQRHPALGQSEAEIEASRLRALSTGQLPDPQLRFGMQNVPVDSLALNRNEMSMTTVGVAQMFPPPGKRDLLQQGAAQETVAAQTRHRDLRARIRHDVHMAWLDLFYQERELGVVRTSFELFDQVVRAALAQYRAGLAQEADVLKAQVERDELRERENIVETARRQAQSRLARLIGLPAATLAVATELPPPPAIHTEQELIGTLPSHPQVATLDAQIRAAELELAAARRDYYPEFGVEAMYGYRAARDMGGAKVPDMLSAGVVMSLPLFPVKRQDARAQERQARLLALRYQRDNLLLELRQQAQARLAEYTGIASRLELVERTLLPQAGQTVDALLAAWRTGKTDMASVLRARQATLDYSLRLWRMRTELWMAAAEINYLGATVVEDSHEH
ncbi:MAG: TolC family protein [Pseudomonadota bacterium]